MKTNALDKFLLRLKGKPRQFWASAGKTILKAVARLKGFLKNDIGQGKYIAQELVKTIAPLIGVENPGFMHPICSTELICSAGFTIVASIYFESRSVYSTQHY